MRRALILLRRLLQRRTRIYIEAEPLGPHIPWQAVLEQAAAKVPSPPT